MEREKKGEWGEGRQNEKGESKGEGGSETETGWRESGLTSVLFMPLREQGLSLCPVCLFKADRGWNSEGRGVFCVGGVKWQNVLIQKKPCLLSSHSDTIKQLGEGCPQSLIILLQCLDPFGEWYHETALHRASYNTRGCAIRGDGLYWGKDFENVLHPGEISCDDFLKQLTRSLQYWHRSLPPMKRVTSFQSFSKSTAYIH